VKDGNAGHITREPEQVKAFRDTWRDGIHSYLTYLRDRFMVARDLLTDTGSMFVQISDENFHRVTSLMDEVFGDRNRCTTILMKKSGWASSTQLPQVHDFIIWYAKDIERLKYRQLHRAKAEEDFGDISGAWVESPDGTQVRPLTPSERLNARNRPDGWKLFLHDNLTSTGPSANASGPFEFQGRTFWPGVGGRTDRHWKTITAKLPILTKANRLMAVGSSLRQKRYLGDFSVSPIADHWDDTAVSGFADAKVYVVQTNVKALERCLLMTTDPGDLVLDPTCGSGTTAFVAEQWARRWITIDTSRVALALARARIMGARYPFYLLADSRDGQLKEGEVTRTASSTKPVHGDIRHGFVYERVPHITLKSIANNTEIDVIWEQWQPKLDPLRGRLNAALKKEWQDWEIPREADKSWPESTKKLHAEWWEARIARQTEINASIAAKAEFEYLYDKPYADNKKVRVAGPFTVESLSPHRLLGVDQNDELIDSLKRDGAEYGAKQSFPEMILENLKIAGVQQAHKEDRITFTALTPWAGGGYVCAEGRYMEGEIEKRAAIFIGPEFGTVQRADLVAAAREAGDASFDVLIACAFNYEAHTTEFNKLGRIPVLKARMNADLHMADDLKNTGRGNLFVIFGEPDIDLIHEKDDRFRVKVNGVDVFKPQTGEVISDNADGIACWFIDPEYNEESFFVRHAYFLGANDPYSALKTTLKAEIDPEAWATLNSDISRPFDKPKSGRIAVKVINHLGDEVMKVFRVA
jgi:adenine-specific DNA-methyltransferase